MCVLQDRVGERSGEEKKGNPNQIKNDDVKSMCGLCARERASKRKRVEGVEELIELVGVKIKKHLWKIFKV